MREANSDIQPSTPPPRPKKKTTRRDACLTLYRKNNFSSKHVQWQQLIWYSFNFCRVKFLACDMPVRLVPCLVDCKPGKTQNRGQLFPYLLLYKENNRTPRIHNMRGWTRTGFSDILRSVNSFHNTSQIMTYLCIVLFDRQA